MAYLTQEEIAQLGLKKAGKSIKISDKASICNPELLEIGDYSRIDDFCVLSGKITMGRNVHLAVFCNLAGGREGIFLGDFSGVAYSSHIMTQVDDYSGEHMTNPTLPAKYTKITYKEVRLERHALVGTNSIILPGAHISEGTAIGALSLVHRPTEPWYIYMGSPAMKIKPRKKDLLELEKQYLAGL